MKKLFLVLNPIAGVRQARRVLTEMADLFTRAGYLVTVYPTASRGDAFSFAAAYGGQADLLVACGGDGTLNETVSGLLSAGLKTPIGYLPAGSTNDFASGLNIPTNLMKACEQIIEGAPHPLDIGLFGESRYFCYTASFGAFTEVATSTPQNVKNLLGHAAYILQGIRSLADIRPLHLKITADGETHEGAFIFGAICNSTSLGGILKLEKDQVHMNDGLFESLLIPFPADLIVLNQIISALSARRWDDPRLIFLRASSFVIEGDPLLPWTLDGEEAAGAPLLTVRNLPGAVRLVY